MRTRSLRHLVAAALVAGTAACADGPVEPARSATEPGPAPLLAPAPGVQGIADRYVVVFRDGVDDVPGTAERLTAAHGGTLHHTYRHALRGFAATLSAAGVEAVRSDPGVAYVEADQVVEAPTAAQDTQTFAPWHLDRIDQRDLPLNTSYTFDFRGTGVRVYVVDTGIDVHHEEFGGRAAVAYDALGGNGEDCNGHGTMVAGVVGAATWGVAKDVQLRSVRVLDCNGSGTLSGVIAGVDWITANHIAPAVANISLSGGPSTSLDDAVQRLSYSGVTVAAAAGNNGDDACSYSPGRVPEVLTVGSSDQLDNASAFSAGGPCLDLYAPGEQITTTWPGNGIQTGNSTGFAAPAVAGAAALVLEEGAGWPPDVIIARATVGRLRNVPPDTHNRLLYTLRE